MKVAVMQPYLLPYIGYFQLIKGVDRFILYDNIKYTKKGWINRNRYLKNGAPAPFSVPLRKDSDALDVRDRFVADSFEPKKQLRQFEAAYRKAPLYAETAPLLEAIYTFDEKNLFAFLHHGLIATCAHLGIETKIVVSSTIEASHELKGEERVIDLCKSAGGTTYINAIGGRELYDKERFAAEGIELFFLQSAPVEYRQFEEPFVPWLSIIDVMMFNPVATIHDDLLNRYALV